MIPRFTETERPVQYPDDRRLRVSLRGRGMGLIALVALAPFGAAWIQYWMAGLPMGSVGR